MPAAMDTISGPCSRWAARSRQTACITCGLTDSTTTSASASASAFWAKVWMPCSALIFARCSARVAGADGISGDALSTQPADQAGGHVAGADEGDAGRGHSDSFIEGGRSHGRRESSADANPGRTFGNGSFQILTHAHGQRIQIKCQLVAQLPQTCEGGALLGRILAGGRDAHQTAQAQSRQRGDRPRQLLHPGAQPDLLASPLTFTCRQMFNGGSAAGADRRGAGRSSGGPPSAPSRSVLRWPWSCSTGWGR